MQLLQSVGTVEAEFASLSLILDPDFAPAAGSSQSPLSSSQARWGDLRQNVTAMGESVLVVSPVSTTSPSMATNALSSLHSYLAGVLTSLRPRRRSPDEEEGEGTEGDSEAGDRLSEGSSGDKDASGNKGVDDDTLDGEPSQSSKERSKNQNSSVPQHHDERRQSADHRRMRLDARSQMLRDELRSLVGGDGSSSSSAVRTWRSPSTPGLTLHYLVTRDDLTKSRCSSMLLDGTSSAMTAAPRGVLAVMICVAFSGPVICGSSTESMHSLPLRMRSVAEAVDVLTRKADSAHGTGSSPSDCRRHTRAVLSALLLTDDEAARTDTMVEAEGFRAGVSHERGLDTRAITLALSERIAPQSSSAAQYSTPRTASSIVSKKFSFSAERALRLRKKRVGEKGITVPAATSAYSGTSSADIARITSEQMQVLSIAGTDMMLKAFEGRKGAPGLQRDRIRGSMGPSNASGATSRSRGAHSANRNRKYTRFGDGGSSSYHGADLGSEFDFAGPASSSGPLSPQFASDLPDDATTSSELGGTSGMLSPTTPNSKAAIPLIMRNARDSALGSVAKHKRASRLAATGSENLFATGNGGNWKTKGQRDRTGSINFDPYDEDDEISQASSRHRGKNGEKQPDNGTVHSPTIVPSFDPFADFSSQMKEEDQIGDSSANKTSNNVNGSSSAYFEPTDLPAIKRLTEYDGSSSVSSLHQNAAKSPLREQSFGAAFEQNLSGQSSVSPSQSSGPPILTVNAALNEDLSCSYRDSKISSCSVEGVVQVQVKSDAPVPVPFSLGVRDPNRHIRTLQENKEFVNLSTEREDNEDSPDYKFVVNVPKVDSYYPIMRYKCSNELRPVPIRVQTRVRMYGNFCRVALQISSNPANEDDLTDLNIIMAVPSTVKGETLTTSPSGGVWNASKRSVLWCVAELGDGEKFQLQAQFEMNNSEPEDKKDDDEANGDNGKGSKNTSKQEKPLPSFPVLVRCQCMYAQLSAVKLDVSELADSFPAKVSMKLARRFRLSHREK